MKKKRFKKKPLLFCLVLLVLGIIGGTFAFYYSEVVIPNQFKVRTYDVEIEEEFYGTFGTKKVSFVNKEEDGVPVLLRVYISESFVLREEVDGEIIETFLDNQIQTPTGLQDAVTKNWTESALNDFELHYDGWYYYKKVLDSEESVQILESIQKNENIPSDYRFHDYKLVFNIEAVQATEEAAYRNWGKQAHIEGDDVSWVNSAPSS